jgi:hypothetical protein
LSSPGGTYFRPEGGHPSQPPLFCSTPRRHLSSPTDDGSSVASFPDPRCGRTGTNTCTVPSSVSSAPSPAVSQAGASQGRRRISNPLRLRRQIHLRMGRRGHPGTVLSFPPSSPFIPSPARLGRRPFLWSPALSPSSSLVSRVPGRRPRIRDVAPLCPPCVRRPRWLLAFPPRASALLSAMDATIVRPACDLPRGAQANVAASQSDIEATPSSHPATAWPTSPLDLQRPGADPPPLSADLLHPRRPLDLLAIGSPCFLLRRAGCFCPSLESLLQPPFLPSPVAVKPPCQVRSMPLLGWNRPVALPPPSSPLLDSSVSRPSGPDQPSRLDLSSLWPDHCLHG